MVFRLGDGGCVWFPSKHHYFYLPEWAGKEHFMKKLFKKFAAIGMAAMMIMAMGVTAFAASPGDHSVTLLSSSMQQPPHDSPLIGADVVYDDDNEITTVVVYADVISFFGVAGYVDSLTVNGYVGNITETGETTNNAGESVTYPTAFSFELDGDYTDLPVTLPIEYSITFVEGSTSHASSGYLIINE